jgi:hypothetical protein
MNYESDQTAVELKKVTGSEPHDMQIAYGILLKHNAHQRQLRIDTFACAIAALASHMGHANLPSRMADIPLTAYDLAEAMEVERARRLQPKPPASQKEKV